jgi:hypothetical protein
VQRIGDHVLASQPIIGRGILATKPGQHAQPVPGIVAASRSHDGTEIWGDIFDYRIRELERELFIMSREWPGSNVAF